MQLLIYLFNLVMVYSGYISPEYALKGQFSIKSDVFSFGVILLEIVSGKKNTSFYHNDCLHLIGYVSILFACVCCRNLKHLPTLIHSGEWLNKCAFIINY